MASKKLYGIFTVLNLRGSVIPSILSRVIFCGLFGFLVSLAFYFNLPVSHQVLGSVIPSIVLGLLLVFRTNTAYERFWEGRKLWGSLVNNTRNLSRLIWVSIREVEPEDKMQKIAALRLIVAFAIATKLHLRGEVVNRELEELMPLERYHNLKTMNHPPSEIAFWIGDYLQVQMKRENLSIYQLPTLQGLINNLVDNLGGCERILKTPIPLAYSIHLNQLLFLYCLLLPFQLVDELAWWTGAVTSLVSFTLFGIEAIGIEIENPFGYDANDLPLDAICKTMKRNVEDLIRLTPSVRQCEDFELPNPIFRENNQ
ncbi:MAG: bestrophin family ion channel [Coleofasciculaceae cyanobacterium]